MHLLIRSAEFGTLNKCSVCFRVCWSTKTFKKKWLDQSKDFCKTIQLAKQGTFENDFLLWPFCIELFYDVIVRVCLYLRQLSWWHPIHLLHRLQLASVPDGVSDGNPSKKFKIWDSLFFKLLQPCYISHTFWFNFVYFRHVKTYSELNHFYEQQQLFWRSNKTFWLKSLFFTQHTSFHLSFLCLHYYSTRNPEKRENKRNWI